MADLPAITDPPASAAPAVSAGVSTQQKGSLKRAAGEEGGDADVAEHRYQANNIEIVDGNQNTPSPSPSKRARLNPANIPLPLSTASSFEPGATHSLEPLHTSGSASGDPESVSNPASQPPPKKRGYQADARPHPKKVQNAKKHKKMAGLFAWKAKRAEGGAGPQGQGGEGSSYVSYGDAENSSQAGWNSISNASNDPLFPQTDSPRNPPPSNNPDPLASYVSFIPGQYNLGSHDLRLGYFAEGDVGDGPIGAGGFGPAVGASSAKDVGVVTGSPGERRDVGGRDPPGNVLARTNPEGTNMGIAPSNLPALPPSSSNPSPSDPKYIPPVADSRHSAQVKGNAPHGSSASRGSDHHAGSECKQDEEAVGGSVGEVGGDDGVGAGRALGSGVEEIERGRDADWGDRSSKNAFEPPESDHPSSIPLPPSSSSSSAPKTKNPSKTIKQYQPKYAVPPSSAVSGSVILNPGPNASWQAQQKFEQQLGEQSSTRTGMEYGAGVGARLKSEKEAAKRGDVDLKRVSFPVKEFGKSVVIIPPGGRPTQALDTPDALPWKEAGITSKPGEPSIRRGKNARRGERSSKPDGKHSQVDVGSAESAERAGGTVSRTPEGAEAGPAALTGVERDAYQAQGTPSSEPVAPFGNQLPSIVANFTGDQGSTTAALKQLVSGRGRAEVGTRSLMMTPRDAKRQHGRLEHLGYQAASVPSGGGPTGVPIRTIHFIARYGAGSIVRLKRGSGSFDNCSEGCSLVDYYLLESIVHTAAESQVVALHPLQREIVDESSIDESMYHPHHEHMLLDGRILGHAGGNGEMEIFTKLLDEPRRVGKMQRETRATSNSLQPEFSRNREVHDKLSQDSDPSVKDSIVPAIASGVISLLLPGRHHWAVGCVRLIIYDEYDDFYKQLAGAYVANDLDLFMTLLRAAAKSLKAFNRHFVHLDIKAANFVVEKRASADQPVKVRLVDLGGALAIGQPLRPRHKFITTWEYCPMTIIFTAVISMILSLYNSPARRKVEWSPYHVGIIEGKLSAGTAPLATPETDEFSFGMMTLPLVAGDWIKNNYPVGPMMRELSAAERRGDPTFLRMCHGIFYHVAEAVSKVVVDVGWKTGIERLEWRPELSKFLEPYLKRHTVFLLRGDPPSSQELSMNDFVNNLTSHGYGEFVKSTPAEVAEPPPSHSEPVVASSSHSTTMVSESRLDFLADASASLFYDADLGKHQVHLSGTVYPLNTKQLLFTVPALFGFGHLLPPIDDQLAFTCCNPHYDGEICDFATECLEDLISHMKSGICQPERIITLQGSFVGPAPAVKDGVMTKDAVLATKRAFGLIPKEEI